MQQKDLTPFPPPPLAMEWVLAPDHVYLSNAHPVQWLQHCIANGFRRHSHAFTELVMVQQGAIPHQIFDKNGDCQTMEIQGGDFLVVPPGLVHGYGGDRNGCVCRRIDICYLAEWFMWDLDLLWNEGLVPLFFTSHLFRRTDNLQIWKIRLSDQELSECENELEAIEREYLRPDPSLLYVCSSFFRFLVTVARAWKRQTSQSSTLFHPEIWGALQAVDLYIKKGQNLNIKALSRSAGCNPKNFARHFQGATGLSVTEYFGKRRTQHAAHLLLESELSVKEIAIRLGFYDSAHLSRVFLRNEGLSPREFRTRYRKN